MSSFHGPPLADIEDSSRNETEHQINNPTLYLKQQEKEEQQQKKKNKTVLWTEFSAQQREFIISNAMSQSLVPFHPLHLRGGGKNKQTANGSANMFAGSWLSKPL